jgi:protein TonB
MPEFKGGQKEFINYIVANVKYPQEAKEKGITGKVFIEFIVNKKGKVTTARVLESVDPLLDAEALRVISTMPDWIPGENENGKPVNVSMALPINFRLDDRDKDKEKK